VTHDILGRYVEASFTVQFGFLGTVTQNLTQLRLVLNSDNPFGFPNGDDITFNGNTIAHPLATTRMAPPNSAGTRGTYIESLIVQALQAPCSTPAPVNFDPPENQDVPIQ